MKIRTRLFILVIILSACSSSRTVPSILADQVCGKSCWNGIILGETEKQELFTILANLHVVNQDSIAIINIDSSIFTERVFFSLYQDPKDKHSLVNASAYVIDQKVVIIIFNGDLGIRFQDVVEIFGEPEFVSSAWYQGGGIDISFVNPSEGVSFSYLAKSEGSNISPEIEVKSLELFDTSLYQMFLESNWLTPGFNNEFILYPWDGYGKIEELYWPPK